jgi:UDP-N-acetylglucosamine 2-epimerase (non-hydrolysing)/GDP/UDP-N,N'-diacetylbacillosamine 2-epimerase (hydrolysing)
LISNLGQEDYLGAMREAEVVIGNSSSGLIEAPAAKTPTVNVGPRQDGRLRAASVIDCLEESTAIEGALRQALDPSFRNSCFDEAPPYGQPSNASQKIVSLLQATDLENVLIKKFHDLTFQNLEETP